MLKRFTVMMLMLVMILVVCFQLAPAVEQHRGVVVGVVLKVDAAAKTVVVKVADGSEHTFHFVQRTAVHGAQDTADVARDSFHGLKEGSQVAVHYTVKGTDETAEEVDNIGKEGLKSTEVTVTHIDRSAKTLSVKTADGTDQVYRLTDSAAKDAGEDVAAGTEKSAKVTVYYTEEGGHKVAHFFRKAF
jgi:hypothetical protein